MRRLALGLLPLGLAVALALSLGAADAPAASPGASIPSSPVDGVVVKVDSAGLSAVKGFRLRTSDGVVLDLVLGTLENATEFAPGHLAEHLATSSPVRVSFRSVDGRLVVYRLEDAPLASPAAT